MTEDRALSTEQTNSLLLSLLLIYLPEGESDYDDGHNQLEMMDDDGFIRERGVSDELIKASREGVLFQKEEEMKSKRL
jgi:hypothetical protein